MISDIVLQLTCSNDVQVGLFLSEQPPDDEIDMPAFLTYEAAVEWDNFCVGDEQLIPPLEPPKEKQHLTVDGLDSHKPLIYNAFGHCDVSTHLKFNLSRWVN